MQTSMSGCFQMRTSQKETMLSDQCFFNTLIKIYPIVQRVDPGSQYQGESQNRINAKYSETSNISAIDL